MSSLMHESTFVGLDFQQRKHKTRCERLLEPIDGLVP